MRWGNLKYNRIFWYSNYNKKTNIWHL